MPKPIVAIVGRPNVGKSTIFNKLTGQRLAIVEDTPGVTRDRIFCDCEWNGHQFLLVDTGGIEPNIDDGLLMHMRRQAQIAIDSADCVVMVTELTAGVTPQDIDIAGIVQEQLPFYEEIYASRGIVCTTRLAGPLEVRMNESLATILVTNLLKNAYVHTSEEGHVEVVIQGRRFEVRNDGSEPLNADHIFDRFYQGKKKEGSTGLGLALVSAVGRYYGLRIEYRFDEGQHCFSVTWPER